MFKRKKGKKKATKKEARMKLALADAEAKAKKKAPAKAGKKAPDAFENAQPPASNKKKKAVHTPTVAPETPLPDAPGMDKAPSKTLESSVKLNPAKIETDPEGRPRSRSGALNKETAEKLLENTPRGAFNMPTISSTGRLSQTRSRGRSSVVGRSRARSTRSPKHGWTEKEIEEAILNFEKSDAVQDQLQQKQSRWKPVNRLILSENPPLGLKNLCKGLGLGRTFVETAKKQKHEYMIANTQSSILTIPWKGPLSIGGMMCQPSEPIYNAVSLCPKDHARIVRHMQLALRRAMADVARPGTRARKVYMNKLRAGLKFKPSAPQYTAIKQKKNGIDSTKMTVDDVCAKVEELLDGFHATAAEHGQTPDEAVSNLVQTAFHCHPSHSVGALHMHGYFLDDNLRMDSMNTPMLAKSTPVDRFMAVLAKTRKVQEPDLSDLVVQVTNP